MEENRSSYKIKEVIAMNNGQEMGVLGLASLLIRKLT